MPVWKFAGTEGAGIQTALWDVPLDLDVEDGPHLDIGLDLAVSGISWSDAPLDLEVLAGRFLDLGLDLAVTDGLLISDVGLDLQATDGNFLLDVLLDLAVVDVIPAFRSVVAQRVSSVLREV